MYKVINQIFHSVFGQYLNGCKPQKLLDSSINLVTLEVLMGAYQMCGNNKMCLKQSLHKRFFRPVITK